ncbi:restriction endonuclease subunit S [Phormidesmis sp. 146-35]
MLPQAAPLSELLKGYRVGITVSRFQKKETGCPESEVSAHVLKNQDLGDNTRSLTLKMMGDNVQQLQQTDGLIKHQLQPGNVVVTLKFIEFWAVCMSAESFPLPLYAYNNLAVLVPNVDLVLPEFLTLWLRSKSAQTQISERSTQVTKASRSFGRNFSSMSLTALVSLPISVPSLDEQKLLVQEFYNIVIEQQAFEQQTQQRQIALQEKLHCLGQ